ncbi:MAG: hypothetical protein EOP06_08370 [Proteobacteria bacterium]|nr:MAG: hypothetical protein EOP06_08370 [Pseudomonadota bacterium]
MMFPITAWLFHRQEQLAVEVLEMTDIGDNWLPGLFDIEIHLTYDGETHAGRGQSFDRDLAVEKACAEAIERLGFAEWGRRTSRPLTSSGFAAHRTHRKASLKAKSEIIERDVLMCSMLSGAKFRLVPPEFLKAIDPRFQTLLRRLRKAGIDLKTAELASDFKERVFLSSAFGHGFRKPFGCNIGMGISKNPSEAIEKSIQECLMMISYNLAGVKTPSLSLNKFAKLKKPEFVEHSQLGFDLKYARGFEKRFAELDSDRRLMTVDTKLYESFKVESIALPKPFDSCPIAIVRAENRKLQQVILGVPDRERMNEPRLKRYAKSLQSELRLETFNLIHVLG